MIVKSESDGMLEYDAFYIQMVSVLWNTMTWRESGVRTSLYGAVATCYRTTMNEGCTHWPWSWNRA